MDKLAPFCDFVPSNDIDGDCATVVALRFDTAEKAQAVASAKNVPGTVPINTGKHIYKNWTPIMEKRGALHPLMDPFKMEANKDIVPDYKEDMCPKTLDLLAKRGKIFHQHRFSACNADSVDQALSFNQIRQNFVLGKLLNA